MKQYPGYVEYGPGENWWQDDAVAIALREAESRRKVPSINSRLTDADVERLIGEILEPQGDA